MVVLSQRKVPSASGASVGIVNTDTRTCLIGTRVFIFLCRDAAVASVSTSIQSAAQRVRLSPRLHGSCKLETADRYTHWHMRKKPDKAEALSGAVAAEQLQQP